MGYRGLSLRISMTLMLLLGVCLTYAQSEQNPDGNLIFYLKDKNKDIKFELLKYTHNQHSIIHDRSGIYSVNIKGLKADKTSSVTNLRILNGPGASCFDLELGWSWQVKIEITKKRKNKIEVMTVLFDNVYPFSITTQLAFKKGNYLVNVKEFFKSEGINGTKSQRNIDPKYFKKVEE